MEAVGIPGGGEPEGVEGSSCSSMSLPTREGPFRDTEPGGTILLGTATASN